MTADEIRIAVADFIATVGAKEAKSELQKIVAEIPTQQRGRPKGKSAYRPRTLGVFLQSLFGEPGSFGPIVFPKDWANQAADYILNNVSPDALHNPESNRADKNYKPEKAALIAALRRERKRFDSEVRQFLEALKAAAENRGMTVQEFISAGMPSP